MASDRAKTTGPPELPAWIRDSDAFRRMTAHQRNTLRTIARRCRWTPFCGGTLGVALLGGDFPEEAGLSIAGMYRHAALLEGANFIVCIGRLGRQGVKCYAIPGSPSALKSIESIRFKSIAAARAHLEYYSKKRGDDHSKTRGDEYSKKQAPLQDENRAYSKANGACSKAHESFWSR
ncbi:MAG: hypothetical protein J5J06_05120 [Phycisphaerae bacterium]|nr:hypothetical protein [Phycisphaerae bacterium]